VGAFGKYLLTILTTKKVAFPFTIVLIIFPVIISDAYIIHLLILSLMYAALSLGWNYICGYAGIFSFGHQGFFGLGAYVSALLAMKAGVSPWFGLLLGGISAGAISLVIGFPCLRLRAAPYVALTTLGFSEILRIICMNLGGLTRGESGLWGIPTLPDVALGPFIISFAGGSRIPYYYVMLIIFFITAIILYWQIHSSTGLALRAIRESQDAAESLGVHITRYKLLTFLISSFFAGVVGAFYGHYINILTPTSIFNLSIMFEILAIVIIGGMGTFSGPIVGAFILTIGLEYLRAFGEYRLMIYGVLIMIMILFASEGIIRKIIPKSARV
jgi:branched-chain amino acid transport system permease protein